MKGSFNVAVHVSEDYRGGEKKETIDFYLEIIKGKKGEAISSDNDKIGPFYNDPKEVAQKMIQIKAPEKDKERFIYYGSDKNLKDTNYRGIETSMIDRPGKNISRFRDLNEKEIEELNLEIARELGWIKGT